MGEGLLHFYQTKLKTEYKIAFFSTFITSLLIHLYKFANTLPHHDSIRNYHSTQFLPSHGRWALSWACGTSSYYDLPWVIGLISCIFIALTVVVIVALFKIKNPVFIGLIGALLASSPATTETFFFLYTADGYMIAMFLSSLAVYLSRIGEKRFPNLLLSGVLICISCGIYQSYVSFALVLAVCYFMDALFDHQYSKKEYLQWILHQVLIYSLALLAYYIIWKLSLRFTDTAVTSYQGITEVGKISLDLLTGGVLRSIKSTYLYFLQWNVFEHGFTLYSALNLLFFVSMGGILIFTSLKSGIFKRRWATGLLILCLIAIIPFACMWNFTTDSITYRAIMFQSFTLLFIFTGLLYEKWAKVTAKNGICLLLLLIVFHNSILANVSYFYMNMSYERTYADGVEMMIDIHDLQDDYEFDKIAVVGQRFKEMSYQNKHIDKATGEITLPGKFYVLSARFEESMLYEPALVTQFLSANFGLDLEPVDREQRKELFETPQVQEMGCWPAGDSMKVIGDTLIIKLSDNPE